MSEADRVKVERVEALLRHADEYGDFDQHNEGCQGEPTCPACWVTDIRRALNPDTGGSDARALLDQVQREAQADLTRIQQHDQARIRRRHR